MKLGLEKDVKDEEEEALVLGFDQREYRKAEGGGGRREQLKKKSKKKWRRKEKS